MEISHTRSRPNCDLFHLNGAAAMGGGLGRRGMTEPKIYTIKLSALLDDPANANRGTERGQYMLDASIAQVGAGRGIVIDREGRIIAGNKTRQALMDAGIDEAVVVETDGRQLVITQRADMDLADNDPNNPARQYAYYDNRTSEVSLDWDPERILADVQSGFDFVAMFQDDELAELLGGLLDDEEPKETAPQIDRAEELQEEWGTELGQVWQLGQHRLICGDCTDRAVVERVMEGEQIEMWFTDPPYGVSYGDKNRHLSKYDGFCRILTDIENDQATGGIKEIADKVWKPAFANMYDVSRPGCVYYMTMPQGGDQMMMMMMMMMSEKWLVKHELIWIKDRMVFGRADYHYQHEPIMYGWKPGGSHYFIDDRTQVSVWEIKRPASSKDHPTEKPIELIEKGIVNSSKNGWLIGDFFLGSGTTLIACENLNRQCRAVEISPGYVAVTLQRFLDHTGIQPELIS